AFMMRFIMILVVEDEDGVRRLVRKILHQQGYNVLEAHHGMEALLIYEQCKEPIHLLLTDTIMPQMNGHELAERLNSLQPGIKIIYISGYTDRAIVDVDFLEKPFSPEALAKKVREVLDKVSV
ncbi:MAG: response regulator, partial [Elusimicrobia bacterium]|nr:response regulator [Candidatus Obscuribacterium magneticum]